MSSCVGGSKAPPGTISAIYTRYAGTISTPIKTSGENRQMKQLGIFAAVTIE